jgi:hypothetical protein
LQRAAVLEGVVPDGAALPDGLEAWRPTVAPRGEPGGPVPKALSVEEGRRRREGHDERLAVTADLEPADADLTTVMRRPVTPADLVEAVDHLREVLAGWSDQLEMQGGTEL